MHYLVSNRLLDLNGGNQEACNNSKMLNMKQAQCKHEQENQWTKTPRPQGWAAIFYFENQMLKV